MVAITSEFRKLAPLLPQFSVTTSAKIVTHIRPVTWSVIPAVSTLIYDTPVDLYYFLSDIQDLFGALCL